MKWIEDVNKSEMQERKKRYYDRRSKISYFSNEQRAVLKNGLKNIP